MVDISAFNVITSSRTPCTESLAFYTSSLVGINVRCWWLVPVVTDSHKGAVSMQLVVLHAKSYLLLNMVMVEIAIGSGYFLRGRLLYLLAFRHWHIAWSFCLERNGGQIGYQV